MRRVKRESTKMKMKQKKSRDQAIAHGHPLDRTTFMNKIEIYRCRFCGRTFPSQQGRRSHLAQVQTCRSKALAAITSTIELEDSAGDEDDDKMDETSSTYVDDLMHNLQPDASDNSPSTTAEHDNGTSQRPRWIEKLPGPAGTKLRCAPTVYEQLKHDQEEIGIPRWGPFESEENWMLAKWVLALDLTQNSTNQLLDLPTVSLTIQ